MYPGLSFPTHRSNKPHGSLPWAEVYVNSYMEDGTGRQTGTDATKLATITEVKEIAAEIAGGGPTTKHDGNRYCKIGLSTTTLDNGDVMFLNDQLVSEANAQQDRRALPCRLLSSIGTTAPSRGLSRPTTARTTLATTRSTNPQGDVRPQHDCVRQAPGC